jgi:hypothetical protein
LKIKKLSPPPQVLLYFEVNVGGVDLHKKDKRLPTSIPSALKIMQGNHLSFLRRCQSPIL